MYLYCRSKKLVFYNLNNFVLLCAPTGKFDELHIWKEARNLVKEVYFQLQGNENEQFGKIVRRTAMAVLCNIAEGYSSGSQVVFQSFLSEAAGCCHEIRDFLDKARTHKYLNEEGIEKMERTCVDMLAGIRQTLRKMDDDK